MKVMGLKPLPQTPLKRDYLRHDGTRTAAIFNVPFKYHGLKGHNSLAACRAFLWLKRHDTELAVHFARRIFKRLWIDGRDITPAEVVAEEASALGVDAAELIAAITSDAGKQALNEAMNHAINGGAFGVPYFVADGKSLWGCDRLWMLEYWLAHGTWEGAGAAGAGEFGKIALHLVDSATCDGPSPRTSTRIEDQFLRLSEQTPNNFSPEREVESLLMPMCPTNAYRQSEMPR